MYVYVCMRTYVGICMCICTIYVCVCMYMYVYILAISGTLPSYELIWRLGSPDSEHQNTRSKLMKRSSNLSPLTSFVNHPKAQQRGNHAH